MPLKIVHEDADVIVIDKPAGLVVHPGAGQPDRTLLNALLAHAPALAGVPRAGHRAPARQGHERAPGGREDGRGAGRSREAACRSQHAARLPRRGAGRPAGERHDRRAARPRRALAHAHGGHAPRQARAHRLPRGRALRPRGAGRVPPRDRPHAPDPRALQHIRHPLVGDSVYRRGTRHGLAFPAPGAACRRAHAASIRAAARP